jgi:osmotically-inducible protein OsmY
LAEETLAARIVRRLEQEGVFVVAEETGDGITLSGIVTSAAERRAASDLAAQLAPGYRIDNDLEVQMTLPDQVGELTSDEPSESDLPDSAQQIREMGGEIDPDFTDQTLLTDPTAAVGSGPDIDDPVEEGDDVYVPPSDPVVTTNAHGQTEVLGGFSSDSMEDLHVDRSASDGRLGDEAIADAIRRELREDAATTELDVRVMERNGVAHLRGAVPGLDDAEAAEEVASRVPGVVEVVEELEVATL